MALGTVHVSAKAMEDALALLIASASVKVAFIDNSVTPSVSDSFPCWGAGGTQNYSTAEVTGGNFVAGGTAVTGLGSSLSSADSRLTATSPAMSLASNISNPSTIYWAIFYDNADANKRVLCYVDMAGPYDATPGIELDIAGVGSGTQILFKNTST